MAVLLRQALLLSASALLCAMLLCMQLSGQVDQVDVDGAEGDCTASDDGGDAVSYLQHFAAKGWSSASTGNGPEAKFYREGEESDIPRPGADYPEQLRGVIWLDQTGVYGYSDGVASAPDFLVSFADSLNKSTRMSRVNPGGHTWTWHNSPEGYGLFSILGLVNFEYGFQWNEDYTEARIYPTIKVFGRSLSPWSFLVDFRMVLQRPAEGECPPKPGASKQDVSKCALWVRKSWVLIYPFWMVYPVFRVLDEAGKPIAPYYDKYVAYAKTTARPNEKLAKLLLGKDVQGVEDALSFAGTVAGGPDLSNVTYSEMARAMIKLSGSLPRNGLI